jgi:alpha-L-arabinofuranosidase
MASMIPREFVPIALLFIGAVTPSAPVNGPGSALNNPAFESDNPLAGWQLVTYGHKASVTLDDEAHQGRHALRVSAEEPSDTALGQDIDLPQHGWYRFTGWVKTRGLDPMTAPVSGTYQIQLAGGRGTLASGPSLRGDTDWSLVTLVFQAPADGHIRVAPFLVGFGKGRGTVWFDDMAIEPVDPTRAPVVVTREFLTPARINPFQYGQFIEYLCTLVPGMWAEKLYDGSFEGLSPYKFAYVKETDFREKPWYPTGATNRALHTRDRSRPISGEICLKIAAAEPVPCTGGVAQDGIAVERGLACDFSIYLKQNGVNGPVRVALHRDGTVLATTELTATNEWKKHRVRLVPTASESNATLAITFRGPGTLWLDNASLMPENAIKGWRADVVAAVKAMRPGIIRFGGSALEESGYGDFEWRDTIGDPDRRRPFRAWGGLQPTGPGLEEFVQFCHLVDAEPLICVRITRRTPRDAADQVQYFNGGFDTPMGVKRAKNGHPAPYHVRYWQVANERRGPDYERTLPAFCQAMKQADPGIELLSSYPTPGVLKGAGQFIGYVSPHHYDCADVVGVESDLASIRRMINEYAPGRSIQVGVTEWNTTAGDWGPRRAMLWTLDNALACARYHNLIHRRCDLVAIACRSNLTNSFCSGGIQTDNHRLFKTPVYYAQQLYATLAGDRPLKIDSPIPPGAAPDISATLSSAGDAVILFAVNQSQEAISRPLDFSAFAATGEVNSQAVEVWTLGDSRNVGERDVTNSFGEPERIVPRRSTISPGRARFDYQFPSLSLTVLKWKTRAS